jgi:hypothetical protein
MVAETKVQCPITRWNSTCVLFLQSPVTLTAVTMVLAGPELEGMRSSEAWMGASSSEGKA